MDALPAADRELLAATAAAITASRDELANKIVAECYRNPFWEARYGERGRARSLEDALHNLDNLSASLRLDLPAELVSYYRWLRDVLAPRGISGEHMREILRAQAAVLAESLLPDQAAITSAWFEHAAASLVYEHPFALAVASGEVEIVAGALGRLATESAEQGTQLSNEAGQGRREHEAQDLRYYLSYLSDAIALGKPDLFTGYTSWVAGTLAQEGASAAGLRAELRALASELESRIPDYATQVQRLVEAGVSAVKVEASGVKRET
jgi:hypothetical protein